jgi:hypothetical protein
MRIFKWEHFLKDHFWPMQWLKPHTSNANEALAARSSGIVSACHRGDWRYGSWNRIPPGYRECIWCHSTQ